MPFRDQVTWPYLDREVDDSLDPDLIERHGREILARATIHGRLVAFLGAGVSMAYGRLSWMQLVKRTLLEVEKIDAAQYARFEPLHAGISTRLRTLQDKLRLVQGRGLAHADGFAKLPRPEENRPLLILQLCSDLLELARSGGERLGVAPSGLVRTLPGLYAEALSDSRVHDDTVHAAAEVFGSGSSNRRARHVNDCLAGLAGRLKPEDAKLLPSRRYFLAVLTGAAAPLKGSGAGEGGRANAPHDNGQHSPIALLMHDLKVHRFATTNYDFEIERALQAAQARPLSPAAGPQVPSDRFAAPTDLRYESFSLVPDTTATAVAFSVEGRRRHAAVMHLHGSVADPASMIASERDYQARYLRNSPHRDLLDNAIRTLFGANPVLYVGSGISEDDVLRPLREFMSLALRRADRLGVALLPANEDEPELAMRKIDCLVRYGIHVMHYGYASGEPHGGPSFDWSKPVGKSWLCEFSSTVRALKARLEILSRGDVGKRAQGLARLDPLTQAIAAPRCMDGQDCGPAGSGPLGGGQGRHAALDIDAECGLLAALVKDFGSADDFVSPKLQGHVGVLLDELTTSVTTAFICARLMTEVDFRHAWEGQLTRPIDPIPTRDPIRFAGNPDIAAGESERVVYRHMTIKLCHRFSPALARRQYIDPRWQLFLDCLERHEAFLKEPGRRMILLPVPRGAGKGSLFDQLTTRPSRVLQEIQRWLSRSSGGACAWRTGLISLNFLSDITNIADVIARIIAPRRSALDGQVAAEPEPDPTANNVIARLERALQDSIRPSSAPGDCLTPQRIMLVLANVGVLFDREGQEKNGQVRRVLRLLMSGRFASAPIDFIVFCDEAHVPWPFRKQRLKPAKPAKPVDAAGSMAVGKNDSQDYGQDYERVNRLLMSGVAPPDVDAKDRFIHPPARSLATEVAAPFLRALAPWADAQGKVVSPLAALEGELKRLHRALAGNRIAMTLVFALCDEARRGTAASLGEGPQGERDVEAVKRFLAEVTAAMASHIHESVPETAIQFVFDRWALLHMRQPGVVAASDVRAVLAKRRHGVATGLPDALWRVANAAERLWAFSVELLLHLAVFSHPVEIAVLAQCPDIRQRARQWLADADPSFADKKDGDEGSLRALIEAVLELCVFRCLAMRISRRRRELDDHFPEQQRYTVHRMVQRYFIRMIGGRNIEGIEWDQFTTSLYVSQPDEMPALSAEAHLKIKALIKALSGYGRLPDDRVGQAGARTVEAFQALRAAYFVARSTYSVGVLSHIASQSPAAQTMPSHGHMEEYRRMIRWITHRAQSLQERNGGEGYFHRGEIVWLYAECGVMSLTQGKLEDAESLLNLALQAARRVECDETGSLHVRLLLHVSLTRIERGQPRAARRLLEPIAQRRGGHPIPPLIAEFYLGVIEHLGGEYHSAEDRYDKALKGFRKHKRTRAAAFVLKSQADLHAARHPEQLAEAIGLAQEAVSLAQRGGHEDVRMLAILTLVRLRAKKRADHDNGDAYRLLELAGKYAADMGMPRIQAAVHEVRATVLLSQGETNLSAREATASAEIAALYDLKLFKAKALLTLALIYKRRNETRQAGVLIRTGLEMAHASEYFSCVRGFRALEATLAVAPEVVGG